jgi:hypothetical protein
VDGEKQGTGIAASRRKKDHAHDGIRQHVGLSNDVGRIRGTREISGDDLFDENAEYSAPAWVIVLYNEDRRGSFESLFRVAKTSSGCQRKRKTVELHKPFFDLLHRVEPLNCSENLTFDVFTASPRPPSRSSSTSNQSISTSLCVQKCARDFIYCNTLGGQCACFEANPDFSFVLSAFLTAKAVLADHESQVLPSPPLSISLRSTRPWLRLTPAVR